jgi:hypothetical protein
VESALNPEALLACMFNTQLCPDAAFPTAAHLEGDLSHRAAPSPAAVLLAGHTIRSDGPAATRILRI